MPLRLLPDGYTPWRRQFLCHGAPASCFRLLPVPAVPPRRPSQQVFPMALPASNKPHSAEKSTPVWLAIWHIWAGFANSQLLPDAAAGAPSRALSAGSPAERQLFRTDFRFAPSPRRASLAVPPIHEDMVVHGLCGRVPDSAGNVSPWIASARTKQISRPICTDCLRHLRISAR